MVNPTKPISNGRIFSQRNSCRHDKTELYSIQHRNESAWMRPRQPNRIIRYCGMSSRALSNWSTSMIEPKKDFQESGFSKGWLDLTDTKQFQAAVQTTLLEMNLRRLHSKDMATSAAWQKEMEGAMEFLSTLTSLTTKQAEPPPKQDYNLKPV
jgi:hypothetical protein